jgi:monothiol glutaredoxin
MCQINFWRSAACMLTGARMTERSILASDHVDPHALEQIASFHSSIVDEVKSTVAGAPVVVVGMAANPVVKKARKLLQDAGVEYKYLGYGGYLSEWKQRLAIKMWSGWPTFPQVFVNGKLIGGAKELGVLLGDGSLQKRLKG